MSAVVPAVESRPWRSRFLNVDDIRTHVLEAGEGPPLVLVHSGEFGGCSELSWEYLIAGLAEHHRVIAPDWLGFGQTAKIHDFEGKRARMLSHLRRTLQVLDVDRADFIGNSMGATWLTQEAAAEPPGLPIDRMVVISGAGFVPDNEHRRKTLEYDGTVEGMSQLLSAIFVDPVWSTDPDYVARRHALSIAPGAWEAVAAARFKSPAVPLRTEFGQADTTVYERIAARTLLIAGEEDRLRAPGYADELAARIPDCELLVIPGCGHCPNIERADVVLPAVLRFLGE